MSKRTVFDAAGFPLGHYDPETNDQIPADAVAVSGEQWQTMITQPGQWRWAKGQLVAVPVEPEVPVIARKIYWSTLINRLTDEQAELLEEGIRAAGPKARILFQTTSYLDLDNPHGSQLAAAITQAFPADAPRILAGEF